MTEHEGAPPYHYSPDAGRFTSAMIIFSKLVATDPDNPELIMDSEGHIVDSVLARWRPYDPAVLAADLPPDTDLAIYFDCGRQDEVLAFPCNTTFADSLDKHGIAYEFHPFDGGHVLLDSNLQRSITFLYAAMESTTTVLPATGDQVKPLLEE